MASTPTSSASRCRFTATRRSPHFLHSYHCSQRPSGTLMSRWLLLCRRVLEPSRPNDLSPIRRAAPALSAAFRNDPVSTPSGLPPSHGHPRWHGHSLARAVAVLGAAKPHCAYLFANRRANWIKYWCTTAWVTDVTVVMSNTTSSSGPCKHT
jgi:hypothetical protein